MSFNFLLSLTVTVTTRKLYILQRIDNKQNLASSPLVKKWTQKYMINLPTAHVYIIQKTCLRKHKESRKYGVCEKTTFSRSLSCLEYHKLFGLVRLTLKILDSWSKTRIANFRVHQFIVVLSQVK